MTLPQRTAPLVTPVASQDRHATAPTQADPPQRASCLRHEPSADTRLAHLRGARGAVIAAGKAVNLVIGDYARLAGFVRYELELGQLEQAALVAVLDQLITSIEAEGVGDAPGSAGS